jgi:hypothetical protein
MNLPEALHHLVGRTDIVAFRMPGPILTLTRHCRLVDSQATLRGGKVRPYQGCFGDLIATDWQILPLEEFSKRINEAMAQAQAASSPVAQSASEPAV